MSGGTPQLISKNSVVTQSIFDSLSVDGWSRSQSASLIPGA